MVNFNRLRRTTKPSENHRGGRYLEALFEQHIAKEFVHRDADATMAIYSRQGRRAKTLHPYIRAAFRDFRAEIHWQLADGDRVTTYKTYHGTHEGPFLGVAPTHRKIHFETVDVMRVQHGKITDHWGVGNLLSLMQQIGGWTQPAEDYEGLMIPPSAP